MKFSPARMLRALTRPISKRSPIRRDDSGLTTLEWLLIVAAVAGLAALAVVLVRGVVTDTADELEGSTARLATAEFEAETIQEDAQEAIAAINATAATAQADMNDVNERYKRRCERMEVAFRATLENADPPLAMTWTDATGTGLGTAAGTITAPTCVIG